MKDILKLLRIKHWVKNGLVFFPVFFHGSRELIDYLNAGIGFVCFSLIASSVYVINDLRDVEKDRRHEKKKHRPIASGRVSKKTAVFLIVLLVVVALTINVMLSEYRVGSMVCLMVYLLMNVGYSFGWKDKPIIDIVILALGFVLRVLYGAALTGIEASPMLLLTVMMFALYMGLGKRRNEKLRVVAETREVLKNYTDNFLDQNMYMCLTLAIVFYAIWTMGSGEGMVYTVPIVVVICMRYNLVIEHDSDGDPVDVLFSDKVLLGLCAAFMCFMLLVLYVL